MARRSRSAARVQSHSNQKSTYPAAACASDRLSFRRMASEAAFLARGHMSRGAAPPVMGRIVGIGESGKGQCIRRVLRNRRLVVLDCLSEGNGRDLVRKMSSQQIRIIRI